MSLQVKRFFHPNGRLRVEIPQQMGDLTPVADMCWLRGKKVSRKKYSEACKEDAELPRSEH